MKNKIPKLIGTIVGVGAGYLYWHFYACEEGCAITSVWWRSAAYGGFMGYLLTDIIVDFWTKRKTKTL